MGSEKGSENENNTTKSNIKKPNPSKKPSGKGISNKNSNTGFKEKTNKAVNNDEKSDLGNTDNEDQNDDTRLRKLNDEECLEKMKEKFPEDKGLTKTFITRKLKKRIMIYRKLDFVDEDTYKNVENTIPKKTGPNSYLKVTMEICNKEDFSLNSPLMYCMKDLFDAYFIIFKEKEGKMKIVIAGHITKDIISYLKKVSGEEFRNKFSVQTMKIKAYAFYEELVHEFCHRENIADKKIDEDEIKEHQEKFDYLTRMRKAYEDIKLIKVEKN